MRLIDADALKKEFKDSPIGLAMQKLVDTQPTAYDIDEVVEELLQCTVCNGHKDHEKQCGGCAGCLECKLEDAYYKAIDIVKAGMKNE